MVFNKGSVYLHKYKRIFDLLESVIGISSLHITPDGRQAVSHHQRIITNLTSTVDVINITQDHRLRGRKLIPVLHIHKPPIQKIRKSAPWPEGSERRGFMKEDLLHDCLSFR